MSFGLWLPKSLVHGNLEMHNVTQVCVVLKIALAGIVLLAFSVRIGDNFTCVPACRYSKNGQLVTTQLAQYLSGQPICY